MYQKNADALTKNTEVMENTFEKAGLEVLQFNFRPYANDDADAVLIVEIAGNDNFENGVSVKVNLYDEAGRIFLVEDTYIASDFTGYDTISLSLSDDSQTLLKAKKARIYAAA